MTIQNGQPIDANDFKETSPGILSGEKLGVLLNQQGKLDMSLVRTMQLGGVPILYATGNYNQILGDYKYKSATGTSVVLDKQNPSTDPIKLYLDHIETFNVVGTTVTEIYEHTMTKAGTFAFKIKLTASHASSSSYLRVKKNGTTLFQITGNSTEQGTMGGDNSFYGGEYDLEVDDLLEVECWGANSYTNTGMERFTMWEPIVVQSDETTQAVSSLTYVTMKTLTVAEDGDYLITMRGIDTYNNSFGDSKAKLQINDVDTGPVATFGYYYTRQGSAEFSFGVHSLVAGDVLKLVAKRDDGGAGFSINNFRMHKQIETIDANDFSEATAIKVKKSVATASANQQVGPYNFGDDNASMIGSPFWISTVEGTVRLTGTASQYCVVQPSVNGYTLPEHYARNSAFSFDIDVKVGDYVCLLAKGDNGNDGNVTNYYINYDVTTTEEILDIDSITQDATEITITTKTTVQNTYTGAGLSLVRQQEIFSLQNVDLGGGGGSAGVFGEIGNIQTTGSVAPLKDGNQVVTNNAVLNIDTVANKVISYFDGHLRIDLDVTYYTANEEGYVEIRKNGTLVPGVFTSAYYNNDESDYLYHTMSLSGIIEVAVDDEIEIYVGRNSNTNYRSYKDATVCGKFSMMKL
jgi:hypothetical protein